VTHDILIFFNKSKKITKFHKMTRDMYIDMLTST